RSDLASYKKEITKITNRENLSGNLQDAAKGADILIGLSKQDLFSKKIIKSMNKQGIVFALANPNPEIGRREALGSGAYIYASGRSDDENQINNALVFPGFFRGLIEKKILKVDDKMKVRAAESMASLVKNPGQRKFVPEIFNKKLADTI